MAETLLPVGTYVQVTPHPIKGEYPYRAKVAGYDLHGSKYNLARQYGVGLFDSGGWWAFPSEVKQINEED